MTGLVAGKVLYSSKSYFHSKAIVACLGIHVNGPSPNLPSLIQRFGRKKTSFSTRKIVVSYVKYA
jgi:hypothetical protein